MPILATEPAPPNYTTTEIQQLRWLISEPTAQVAALKTEVVAAMKTEVLQRSKSSAGQPVRKRDKRLARHVLVSSEVRHCCEKLQTNMQFFSSMVNNSENAQANA